MSFKVFIIALVAFASLSCDETHTSVEKRNVSWINWYKAHIAPHHPFECHFYPSCSQYTKQAIEKNGLIKGLLCGCDRLMRCNNDRWVYQEVWHEGKLKKYDPLECQ